MNSTKPLIKLGARLTNNNYMFHLSIDKGVKGPNKAIFNTILDNLIALPVLLQAKPNRRKDRCLKKHFNSSVVVIKDVVIIIIPVFKIRIVYW